MSGRQISAAEKKLRAAWQRQKGYVNQFVSPPINLRKAETGIQKAEQQWEEIRVTIEQELETSRQALGPDDDTTEIDAREAAHEQELQAFKLWAIDCRDKVAVAQSSNHTEEQALRNQTTMNSLNKQYEAMVKQIGNEIAAFMFILPKDPELNQSMYDDMRGKHEEIKKRITVELKDLAESVDKLSAGSVEKMSQYLDKDSTELLRSHAKLTRCCCVQAEADGHEHAKHQYPR